MSGHGALALMKRHNSHFYKPWETTSQSLLAVVLDTTEKASVNVSTNPVSNCLPGDLLGPLGLLVQLALALIAFSALIVKRFCEPQRTRRSWRIWFYDTSKQAIGAAVIHFANVFLAGVSKGDPCTWYFVSFLLDSTVGLLVIYAGLKSFQILAVRKKWSSLMFGEYGNPSSGWAWLGQCIVYMVVMAIEKLLVAALVLPRFWVHVRTFLMSWIKDPDLELIIVMFIVPVVVNALVFWVVDNFLKKGIQQKLAVDAGDTRLAKSLLKPRHYYDRVERTGESDCLMSCDDDIELQTGGVSAEVAPQALLKDCHTVL